MSRFPTQISPMLAVSGEIFDAPDYTFEVKWDGIRALAYKDGDHLSLKTRNLKEALPRFPELKGLPHDIHGKQVILDGEIVVFGDDGRPDFGRARSRNAQRNPAAIARAQRAAPAVYVAFDCLYKDGVDLMPLPLRERLRHLHDVVTPSPFLSAPKGQTGEGRALFAAVAEQGLEGVVAKALDSPYEPGIRSRSWIKVRNVHHADCVVGGFVPKGPSSLKSLLLGLYDAQERLHFMGHVGTGFSQDESARIRKELEPLVTKESPFADVPMIDRSTRWVRPERVCTIEFLTVTEQGHFRHATYRGLREDKQPAECRLSTEVPWYPGG